MSERLTAILQSAQRVDVAYEDMTPQLAERVRGVIGSIALTAGVLGSVQVMAQPNVHGDAIRHSALQSMKQTFGTTLPSWAKVGFKDVVTSPGESPVSAAFLLYLDGTRDCTVGFTKDWEKNPGVVQIQSATGMSQQEMQAFVVAHEAQHCLTYSDVHDALAEAVPRQGVAGLFGRPARPVLAAVGGDEKVLGAAVPLAPRARMRSGFAMMEDTESSARQEMISDVVGVLAVQQLQIRQGSGTGLSAQQLRALAAFRAGEEDHHRTDPVLLHLARLVERDGQLNVDVEDPAAMKGFAYGLVATAALPREQGAALAARAVERWPRDAYSDASDTLITAASQYIARAPGASLPVRIRLQGDLKMAIDGMGDAQERFQPSSLAGLDAKERQDWLIQQAVRLDGLRGYAQRLQGTAAQTDVEGLVAVLEGSQRALEGAAKAHQVGQGERPSKAELKHEHGPEVLTERPARHP